MDKKTKSVGAEAPQAQRTYKDHLFRILFREKSQLLSLYNAVNQSSYTAPEELEIVTLENAVYMNMKNASAGPVLRIPGIPDALEGRNIPFLPAGEDSNAAFYCFL